MSVLSKVMNRLACIFGLFAIVLNAALGYAGTQLLCQHDSGDAHLISRSVHAGAGHQNSCHEHGEISAINAVHDSLETCNSCVDTEVVVDKSQDLQRNAGQDRLPMPQMVALESKGIDVSIFHDVPTAAALPLNRATASIESLTCLQVKRTVLRI